MKTDTQLQQDVLDELNWDPSLNAARIGVEVKEGVVTLAGHVGSYSEKYNAERAAQRVAGVRALAVSMDVDLVGWSIRNDDDIGSAVRNVLQWTACLPKNAIQIMVERGKVTLTGVVEWHYQRLAAVSAVSHLMGVTGVDDQLTLHSAVSSSQVKADIESALRRRTSVDALHISVDVNGDDVVLAGTVHSWSERTLARNTAWGTPGVHNVVDNMTVKF